MRDCHPGLASGRGGCLGCLSSSFFLGPLFRPCHRSRSGAEGPGVRVISEGDVRVAKLADQACGLGRTGEPGIPWVDQIEIGALPVPHLAPGARRGGVMPPARGGLDWRGGCQARVHDEPAGRAKRISSVG